MPRIVGIDIPNDKAIGISLTYIHGIGRYTAEKILSEIGVKPDVRANKLTEDEVSKIAQIIDRDYPVEGQLRRQVAQDIARLKDKNGSLQRKYLSSASREAIEQILNAE